MAPDIFPVPDSDRSRSCDCRGGFEEKLKKIMGTQVVIKNKNNNKGKIEIQYYSQAELERIYDMLKKINE